MRRSPPTGAPIMMSDCALAGLERILAANAMLGDAHLVHEQSLERL